MRDAFLIPLVVVGQLVLYGIVIVGVLFLIGKDDA